MGFDYDNTCPIIDENIKDFKFTLEDGLIDMLDECCPLLVNKQKTDFIQDFITSIFNNVETCFEGTRNSNIDMREEAEIQINELEGVINDQENEIYEKNDKITELEDKLKDTQLLLDEFIIGQQG